MRVSVSRSEIAGKAAAPPSKSYTVRALMCAALSRGITEIIRPLSSDDTDVASDVLGKVGVRIVPGQTAWRVYGGEFHAPATELFCRESAATLRFMTAMCALVPGECRLAMAQALWQRPIKPLVDALKQLGVNCYTRDDRHLIMVNGGRLRGGVTSLPGDVSSQFVSALLLIAPLADDGMTIRLTTPLESRPYVLMTLECLDTFGIKVTYAQDLHEFQVLKQAYRAGKYTVEGDWSSASYLLAAGALAGRVEVANLNLRSLQGDKVLVYFLPSMGAPVSLSSSSVTVRKATLRPIKADLTDCIDLLPTVAALAAATAGTSELTGISRARLKESDRVAALREELPKLGATIAEEPDRLMITGGGLHGGTVDSHGDHRIAMALSLLGLVTDGVTIEGAECVAKTFPTYWDILTSLGAQVRTDV